MILTLFYYSEKKFSFYFLENYFLFKCLFSFIISLHSSSPLTDLLTQFSFFFSVFFFKGFIIISNQKHLEIDFSPFRRKQTGLKICTTLSLISNKVKQVKTASMRREYMDVAIIAHFSIFCDLKFSYKNHESSNSKAVACRGILKERVYVTTRY